jgi:hypothetical protein
VLGGRVMRKTSFTGVIAAVFCLAACSSSSNDARPTTSALSSDGQSACSTGPAYVFETAFPDIENADSSLPECVPRCENGDKRSGYGTASNAWTIEALPSGACTNDGEACQMAAVRVRTCPSGEKSMCSYTGYECHCEGGNWKCYSGPKGASACTC